MLWLCGRLSSGWSCSNIWAMVAYFTWSMRCAVDRTAVTRLWLLPLCGGRRAVLAATTLLQQLQWYVNMWYKKSWCVCCVADMFYHKNIKKQKKNSVCIYLLGVYVLHHHIYFGFNIWFNGDMMSTFPGFIVLVALPPLWWIGVPHVCRRICQCKFHTHTHTTLYGELSALAQSTSN